MCYTLDGGRGNHLIAVWRHLSDTQGWIVLIEVNISFNEEVECPWQCLKSGREREKTEKKKRSTCLPRSNKRNIYIYTHTHTCRSKRKCIQWVCVFAKITLSSILHSIIVVVVLSIYWMQLLYVCMYVHTTEVIACYARVATLAVRHTCARLFISDSNESECARTPWRYKATNERWMTRSLPCVGSAAYFDFSSLLLFIVFSFFLRCAKCIFKAVKMVAILQFIYFRFI